MPSTKSNHRHKSKAKPRSKRRYESQAAALQSLRLIAAPNPKDDLSDEELAAICKDSARSPALIRQLIECIKAL